MKVFKFLALALIAFVVTSCGSSYSEEKASKLIEKYQDEGELTKDEWNQAVDLCIAYSELLTDEMKQAVKKAETKKEYDNFGKEFLEKYPEGFKLLMIVGTNAKEIPADALKKLESAQENSNKAQEEVEKELEKKFG